MQVHVKMTYVIELSPEEWALVSKSLRCLLTDEQKPDAAELQDRLFKARNGAVKSRMENLAKMAD